MRSIVFR